MVLLGLTVGSVSCGASFGFCCLRFVLFFFLSWLVVFAGFGFCFILTTVQYCPFWNGSFLFSLEG